MVLNLWFDVPTSCLQVEELATIEFNWLGYGELSTCFCLLHPCFFLEHKHPIELLVLFSDGIVSQDMPDVGVTDTHPSMCLGTLLDSRRILLSVVKVFCLWNNPHFSSTKRSPLSIVCLTTKHRARTDGKAKICFIQYNGEFQNKININICCF